MLSQKDGGVCSNAPSQYFAIPCMTYSIGRNMVDHIICGEFYGCCQYLLHKPPACGYPVLKGRGGSKRPLFGARETLPRLISSLNPLWGAVLWERLNPGGFPPA